jgi:O-antigen ligase
MGVRGSANRSATFSLSLLFPVLILLMLSITLRSEDIADGFDWQLGVRVMGYSLAALSVLFALGMRKMPIDRLIFLWALVPISIMSTSLFAPDAMFSLTAGLAHLVLLLFAWRVVARNDQTAVVFALVISGLVIGAMSIVAYYAFPEIGRSMVEAYTADPGGRMRGVTAQPNTLGTISAFTVLLAVMFFQVFAPRQRVLAAAAIVISAFCLVYSDSRTSIATLAVCLLLWSLRRANIALNLFMVVAIALAASLVMTFVPDISSYLARGESGPTDLSSLNGRSRIWDVAWESIYAHPLFGQGYGASRLILPMDDRLFGAAVNTHSLYLELLFSGGVVLFALFVIAVAAAIIRSAMQGRTEVLIALLFFLIRGAAEAAPFAGLPLFPAFIFYAAVSMCIFRSNGRRGPAYARQRPTNARWTGASRGIAGPLR